MRAIIVSGGNKPSEKLLKSYINHEDIIIGIDKGCNALFDYNIKPDLILGDFDSIKKEVLDYFKKSDVTIEKYKPEKDYTDTDLGYRKAKEIFNADEILLFGATGSRIDHTLGNIGILFKALKDNIKMEIIDDNNRIYLVNKNSIIKKEEGKVISFHALSDIVKKFTIKNAKYNLTNYDMTILKPRAICNEFLDDDIEISFDSGIILVMYSID